MSNDANARYSICQYNHLIHRINYIQKQNSILKYVQYIHFLEELLRTPGLSQEATQRNTILRMRPCHRWYGTIKIPHYSKAVGLTKYMSSVPMEVIIKWTRIFKSFHHFNIIFVQISTCYSIHRQHRDKYITEYEKWTLINICKNIIYTYFEVFFNVSHGLLLRGFLQLVNVTLVKDILGTSVAQNRGTITRARAHYGIGAAEYIYSMN